MLLRRGALPADQACSVPPLYAGDRLSQPEFHRRYEEYPADVKFELIDGKVAHSTAAIDLHDKKDDYEGCGVKEYVVACLGEPRVYWFDLAARRARKLPADGILRSKPFPGLWIDTRALFRGDLKRMVRVLNDGLASPEHVQFVRRLAKFADRKAKSKKRKRKGDE